jgi:hypothetical protein
MGKRILMSRVPVWRLGVLLVALSLALVPPLVGVASSPSASEIITPIGGLQPLGAQIGQLANLHGRPHRDLATADHPLAYVPEQTAAAPPASWRPFNVRVTIALDRVEPALGLAIRSPPSV